jgi:hypothetical protein
LFLAAVPSSYSQTPTIHSVSGCGNWNNASTWVENTVPGPNDVVEINGTVSLYNDVTVSGLSVSAGSVLQSNDYSRAITVNGDIINNGTIQDALWCYHLAVNVTGDITNNGTWNNSWTYLQSSQPRTINGSIAGSVILDADFTILGQPNFSNNFNFNGHTINTGTNSTITFGNTVGTGVITGDAPAYYHGTLSGTVTSAGQIIFADGSYLGDSSVINADVTIAGTSTVRIMGSTTINGSLSLSSGSVLQSNDDNRTITVNGNIINNGTIQNAAWCYRLAINVSGDITNNGTWNNSWTNASWPAVLGAVDYIFDVSADNNNWPDATTTTDTVYNISNLVNSSHYWRVRADLGGGLYNGPIILYTF